LVFLGRDLICAIPLSIVIWERKLSQWGCPNEAEEGTCSVSHGYVSGRSPSSRVLPSFFSSIHLPQFNPQFNAMCPDIPRVKAFCISCAKIGFPFDLFLNMDILEINAPLVLSCTLRTLLGHNNTAILAENLLIVFFVQWKPYF
jgi:hypothetical protein